MMAMAVRYRTCQLLSIPRAPPLSLLKGRRFGGREGQGRAEQLTDKAKHGRADPSDIVTKVEQARREGRQGHGEVEPRKKGALVWNGNKSGETGAIIKRGKKGESGSTHWQRRPLARPGQGAQCACRRCAGAAAG